MAYNVPKLCVRAGIKRMCKDIGWSWRQSDNSNAMNVSQQQIDPNSLMGLLEQIDQRQEVKMKCRKGSKEYKKLQKELEVLRTKYNETAGQKLLIVHTEL